jgi:hypothetical protein
MFANQNLAIDATLGITSYSSAMQDVDVVWGYLKACTWTIPVRGYLRQATKLSAGSRRAGLLPFARRKNRQQEVTAGCRGGFLHLRSSVVFAASNTNPKLCILRLRPRQARRREHSERMVPGMRMNLFQASTMCW